MDNLLSQIKINFFKKDGAVLIKAKFDNTWIKKLKEGIKKPKIILAPDLNLTLKKKMSQNT